LLSFMLGVPLILEYNASELRMADYGDPLRFRGWLRLCEEVSLRRASWIVVVSDALIQELVERGIPRERILLNPNGVDPEVFRPNCGGQELRVVLGLDPSDVVVGFVGTFSYWHGIEVLGQAIRRLLATERPPTNLRFLLIGDGPMCADLRRSLEDTSDQQVRFTGIVPHEKVPAYLDATDILLSPHVSMPDGKPFFGSPTKLFEYMAMSKAIVASNLDQLSRILNHGRSAWLVEPGNPAELASAVSLLARDPHLRNDLGKNARAVVMSGHTWKQNAERVLARTQASAAQSNVSTGIGATA
jgi:glycosyltransferase involved in cell wall biosynthesis